MRIFLCKERNRLTICVVLVSHEGSSGLYLRLQDSIPQLLSGNGLASTTFFLVLLIQCLKLLTINFMHAWSLIRAEQRPVCVGLNTPHAIDQIALLTSTSGKKGLNLQEIRNPKSVE